MLCLGFKPEASECWALTIPLSYGDRPKGVNILKNSTIYHREMLPIKQEVSRTVILLPLQFEFSAQTFLSKRRFQWKLGLKQDQYCNRYVLIDRTCRFLVYNSIF